MTFTVQAIWITAVASIMLSKPPESARDYVARGMSRFTANKISESVRDFDQAAKLDPKTMPHLWQRGISYYYLGEFQKGRAQFESHQAVNPNDVENATWHFICVAKLQGLGAARKSLIKIDTARDRRAPMSEIYELYAGRGTADAVVKAADRAGTQQAQMYAHLYLGLYYEAAGDLKQAKRHMLQAAAAKLEKQYMHEVAKIHLLQRGWKR